MLSFSTWISSLLCVSVCVCAFLVWAWPWPGNGSASELNISRVRSHFGNPLPFTTESDISERPPPSEWKMTFQNPLTFFHKKQEVGDELHKSGCCFYTVYLTSPIASSQTSWWLEKRLRSIRALRHRHVKAAKCKRSPFIWSCCIFSQVKPLNP